MFRDEGVPGLNDDLDTEEGGADPHISLGNVTDIKHEHTHREKQHKHWSYYSPSSSPCGEPSNVLH